MNNPIAILLASFIATTSGLTANVQSFSGKQPDIEREVVEEDIFAMYRHVVSKHCNNDAVVMDLYDKYERLVREQAEKDPTFSAELCLQAVTYGAEKHEGQERKFTGIPYIMHPISVALILFEEGEVKDHYVLAAAALHDTIEDTDATSDEIQYLFGQNVSQLVGEVTNTPDITYESKHAWILEHAKSMSKQARIIKAADRTHNLRSFHEQNFKEGTDRAEKKKAYFTASNDLAKELSGENEQLDEALQKEIDLYFSQNQ